MLPRAYQQADVQLGVVVAALKAGKEEQQSNWDCGWRQVLDTIVGPWYHGANKL